MHVRDGFALPGSAPAQDLLVLTGQVLRPDGAPAGGAVVVTSAGGRAVTRTDGSYEIEVELPLGAESVQVTAVAASAGGGSLVASARASLVSGGRTPVDRLVLTATASCEPSWLPTFGEVPGVNGSVDALAVFDDGSGAALYAGGTFTSAVGVAANSIAKWNGSSWSALGSGVNGTVNALTVFDDGSGPALYAGGSFNVSPAGDSFLAKWGCPPLPFGTFCTACTAKTALFCHAANIGASGTPSATATGGFVVDAQPVRGCRAGLLLYSSQPIQPGIPFGGPGNGLLCLIPSELRRAGPIDTGGTSAQFCDGVMSIDVNAFNTHNWTANGCNPPAAQTSPACFLGNMGTSVSAQMWGRDSTATGQLLSDGIRWSIGP
jgi:hypothetical protein